MDKEKNNKKIKGILKKSKEEKQKLREEFADRDLEGLEFRELCEIAFNKRLSEYENDEYLFKEAYEFKCEMEND